MSRSVQSRWGRSLRRATPGAVTAIGGGSAATPAVGWHGGGVRGRRRRRRLPQLPVHQGRVRRVLRRARLGRIGDHPRLRSGDVLRGLPADRGDGPSRSRHAALRPDEAGGSRGSAHRPPSLRRRAAPAGHAGRRPLQPGRLPDAAQVGRTGAGAADDSRPRARRVRAFRHGASQHFHQRPQGAAADVADQGSRRPVLRRPDLRSRGLRRIGGFGAACRAQRRPRRPGPAAAGRPAHHGHRRAGALRRARRLAPLPAVEHHLRDHAARSTSRRATRRHARPGSPSARSPTWRRGIDERRVEGVRRAPDVQPPPVRALSACLHQRRRAVPDSGGGRAPARASRR